MYRRVLVAEVRSFVERCMASVGTDPKHSAALSQVLTEADARGHFTHGLRWLDSLKMLILATILPTLKL